MVNEFIEEKCIGSIENIKEYNLLLIVNDIKYGDLKHIGDLDKYDPDDSEIAKAIYYLVWNDKIPELEIKQIGSGLKYRGDTLNTFNTLFGVNASRARELVSSNMDFINTVNEFKGVCFSIGNFSLLPNISIIPNGWSRITTINMYRGNFYKWKDYYDKFLLELEYCYENSRSSDKILADLVKANHFYFDEISDIRNYIDINFLDNYYDVAGKNTELFKNGLRNWKVQESEQYINFSYKYIKESTKIIKDRANKMIDIVKRKI